MVKQNWLSKRCVASMENIISKNKILPFNFLCVDLTLINIKNAYTSIGLLLLTNCRVSYINSPYYEYLYRTRTAR